MIKTRLEPTFDRVLVERLPEVNKSAGGMYFPDQSVAKPNQGFIRDAGPYVAIASRLAAQTNVPISGQVFEFGQKVMFGQYAGIEMNIDGTQFVLLKQDEIMAVVHEVSVLDTSETLSSDVPSLT